MKPLDTLADRQAFYAEEMRYKEELRRRAAAGDQDARDSVGGYDEWHDDFDDDC